MTRRSDTTSPASRAEATFATVQEEGVVGIVRTRERDLAQMQAERAIGAGLRVVEVSLTTPGAMNVITELAAASHDAVVGAGTVLTADDARRAIDAGAEILVCPILDIAVIEIAVAEDVAVVPGCLTPSEMALATAAGATAVKIFPAHLWTPAALTGMLQAMPHLRCVPTGGIGLHDAGRWLSAGAAAVGVGTALTAAADPTPAVSALRAALHKAREYNHG